MSKQDFVLLGEISKDDQVQQWVKSTPSCPRCDYYIYYLVMSGFEFKSPRNCWWWVPNDKEKKVWRECAIEMNILPEIEEKISSYLYDETYHHKACNDCMANAMWIPYVKPGGRGLVNAEWMCSISQDDCLHIATKVYPLPVLCTIHLK